MSQGQGTGTITPVGYDHGRPATSTTSTTPNAALHYVALVCALGPMTLGVVAFLLYVVTQHLKFAEVGVLTIVGGCAAAVVGGVCLAVYWRQVGRANADDAAVARRRVTRDAVLLVANFPLATVLTFAGVAMISRADAGVNVGIRNDDAVTADVVTLDTGGDVQHLGPIRSGQDRITWMKFGSRGLTATLTRGGGTSTTHPIFDHMDADTVLTSRTLRLVIRDGRVEQLDQ